MPIMLTLALVTALQAPSPPPADAATARKPSRAKQECTYEDVPGSNFQHRVCRTPEQAQQEKADQATRVVTITRTGRPGG